MKRRRVPSGSEKGGARQRARKSKNRNLEKRGSRDGVCLRIRRGSSKAGKYGKQKRVPEKIKTDEYSERRDEKTVCTTGRERRSLTMKREKRRGPAAKSIAGKKEDDFRQIGKIRGKKRCEASERSAPVYKLSSTIRDVRDE